MRTMATIDLRQRRLGAELRKLRERAGLSSTAAAELLGGSQARISNIEAGRYAVSAERVRAMARNYTCGDEALIDALAAMTGGRTRGWWNEYRDVLPAVLVDVAEFEHRATALRIAVVVHMPGLLQTLEYARAIFRQAVPALLPHEVEHRVSYRMKRQAVLHGDTATPVTAIVHEAALRMGFGGPGVARAQLRHLADMSELENISLRVIPFGGESAFPASGQPITFAHGLVPLLDTVLLDTDHGCEFLDSEAQLAKYRSVLDRMEACAVSDSESRDMVCHIARSM